MRPLLLALMGLMPWPLYGQVTISEIMYDAPGTDAGHEWVEVQNEGSGTIDFASWKFYEGETNHALSLIQGNPSLSGGAYAVIADNPAQFLSDFPSFSGTLFDSSFSLNNTGESIALKDEAGIVYGSVSYSAVGAAGDGNSLQYVGGTWAPGAPTPGAPNTHAAVFSDENSVGEGTDDDGSAESAPSSGGSSAKTAPDTLSVNAGVDRRAVVGSMVTFSALLGGTRAPEVKDHSITWNLGNGTIRTGKTVHYSYLHPGSYAVVVQVDQGELQPSDRVVVRVEPAGLSLTEIAGKGIAIENDTSEEVDLSGWSLSVREHIFVIPHDTFLLPNATLMFPKEVTHLAALADGSSVLRFPSGEIAATGRQVFFEAESELVSDADAAELSPDAHDADGVSRETLSASEAIEADTVAPEASESLAALSTADASDDLPWWTWFLALGAFLGLALGSFLLWRRNRGVEIEIIE